MSNMKNGNITIYEALQNIENGKYIMPAFQRQFVWNMEQIEKLWDSILLNYPIATFLFWHIDDSNMTENTYFCNFLTDVMFDSRKAADSVNYDLTNIDIKYTDTAVLDGQQRLTSLYLSLFGEAGIRPKSARRREGERIPTKLLIELNKNKILIEEEQYNCKIFDIRFNDKVGKISPTQFEVKGILDEKYKDENSRKIAIEEAIVNVPVDSKDYARNIIQTLYRKIFEEKLISYTEIIDMKQDDALEMFVRFNSGGKPLRKSDITMSILEVYWKSAKTEFGEILKDSYIRFDTDFIIRTSFMLYGDVVKSNINKRIIDDLKNDWSKFKKSLNDLRNLLNEMKIEVSRFSNSWNVLLPIIYYIHYNSEYHKNIESIKAYLFRAIFFTYFQSGTTGKLQQIKNHINSFDRQITIEMLNQIYDLKVTEGKIEDVLNSEKGSRVAGEVLYYLNIDWINKNFNYEHDHLHPESRFNKNKPISVSEEDWKKWYGMRNRLPNLHLLEGRSNGGKNDMRLIDYYNDMNDEQKTRFHTEAMIPSDISLEIENFGVFYEARKKILTEKIRKLLG